jgi:hypothetical protein
MRSSFFPKARGDLLFEIEVNFTVKLLLAFISINGYEMVSHLAAEIEEREWKLRGR